MTDGNQKKVEVLKLKKERLSIYLKRESYMLSEDGVKSYGVGTRNLSHYDTDLGKIQDMIKKLEEEISELENSLLGKKPRKAVGIVLRDW